MDKRIVVILLGKSSFKLAQKISKHLNAQLHAKEGIKLSAGVFLTQKNIIEDNTEQFEEIDHEVDYIFSNVMEHLGVLFSEGTAIVGVCATGILIRGVAPFLENKREDPPLVAVGEDGTSVIPLLGGHHGANYLARSIGELIGVLPAITTAGDLRFGISLEEPPEGFALANPLDVKAFTSKLLAGENVMLIQNSKSSKNDSDKYVKNKPLDRKTPIYQWLNESYLPFVEIAKLRITLSSDPIPGNSENLVYYRVSETTPNFVAVGVGCERGADSKELISLVLKVLLKNEIAKERVALVVSLDLKSDEAAVHELAAYFSEITGKVCPAHFFDATSLEAQTPNLKNPSDIVFQEVGCHGVAEGAALAAAAASGKCGSNNKLLVPKIKSARATCAVAELYNLVDLQKIGRPRGTLFVVGIGPGDSIWRIPEAEKMLRDATDWVGYSLYLDLISDLHNGQNLHYFDLGEEELRVQHSLELAAQGKTIALISSGDPGIYAMASLVFEKQETGRYITSGVADKKETLESNNNLCFDKDSNSASTAARWQRVQVQVTPGISALQAASSRIGAPLGNDFCVISLSDLLTTWKTIETRIRAAAEGDFVIAFYNPVSRRRNTQLAKAKDILLRCRSLATPVILARNIGRNEESLRVISLGDLKPSQVDMLTIVLVGSSQTRRVKLPNGDIKVYTPRGYDQKA